MNLPINQYIYIYAFFQQISYDIIFLIYNIRFSVGHKYIKAIC